MGFTAADTSRMQGRAYAMSKYLRSRKRWGLADPFPVGCDRPIWNEHGQSMGYLSAWPHYGGAEHSHIKMLGNSIRSKSIGATSTHGSFDPFGPLELKPYRETTCAVQNGQQWPRSLDEGGTPNVHDSFNSGSNAGGTTAIGVFCEHLFKLWFDHFYDRPKCEPVVACTGFGGTRLAWRTAENDPAHPWWHRRLDYFAKVRDLCAAESKTCGVGLLTNFAGETDHSHGVTDFYATAVSDLTRLEAWVKNSGLTWYGKPACFGHQAGDKWTSANPWLPVSNDQLRLSLDHYTVCPGPSYPYPDDPVGQHYVTNAVRNVALDCLVAAKQIWIDGIDHQPTHWHEVYGKDDEIAFLYHTPDGSPLDWGMPWKGCQQTSFVGMGFHSYGSDGIPNPVLDAWFPEQHVLVVKCQSPITGIGSGAFANYAAKDKFGGMGCLTTRGQGIVWPALRFEYHPEWGDDHHIKEGLGVHSLPIGQEYDTRDWACAQAGELKVL